MLGSAGAAGSKAVIAGGVVDASTASCRAEAALPDVEL
jgi:hypothetical protein